MLLSPKPTKRYTYTAIKRFYGIQLSWSYIQIKKEQVKEIDTFFMNPSILFQKKKSNPGRAARRRKAKERSINEALNKLLIGDELSCSSTDSPVHDRSESLPGVLSLREKLKINLEDDKKLIISQLGYLPGNAILICSRVLHLKARYPHLYSLLSKNKSGDFDMIDQEQCPTTLQLYPLAVRDIHLGGKQHGRKFKSRKRGHDEHLTSMAKAAQIGTEDYRHDLKVLEPFPTMYWLTHPILRILISRIELGTSNNVVETEKKLSSSDSYLKQMERAHESYGRTRWDLLTQEDMKDVIQRNWNDAIGSQMGVAGIQRYETVKCLHTHAAHYLATMEEVNEDDENIVGRWVLDVVEIDVKNLTS